MSIGDPIPAPAMGIPLFPGISATCAVAGLGLNIYSAIQAKKFHQALLDKLNEMTTLLSAINQELTEISQILEKMLEELIRIDNQLKQLVEGSIINDITTIEATTNLLSALNFALPQNEASSIDEFLAANSSFKDVIDAVWTPSQQHNVNWCMDNIYNRLIYTITSDHPIYYDLKPGTYQLLMIRWMQGLHLMAITAPFKNISYERYLRIWYQRFYQLAYNLIEYGKKTHKTDDSVIRIYDQTSYDDARNEIFLKDSMVLSPELNPYPQLALWWVWNKERDPQKLALSPEAQNCKLVYNPDKDAMGIDYEKFNLNGAGYVYFLLETDGNYLDNPKPSAKEGLDNAVPDNTAYFLFRDVIGHGAIPLRSVRSKKSGEASPGMFFASPAHDHTRYTGAKGLGPFGQLDLGSCDGQQHYLTPDANAPIVTRFGFEPRQSFKAYIYVTQSDSGDFRENLLVYDDYKSGAMHVAVSDKPIRTMDRLDNALWLIEPIYHFSWDRWALIIRPASDTFPGDHWRLQYDINMDGVLSLWSLNDAVDAIAPGYMELSGDRLGFFGPFDTARGVMLGKYYCYFTFMPFATHDNQIAVIGYKVEEMSGIGQEFADKLKACGIGTMGQLLQQSSTEADRNSVASAAGLAPDLILEWAHIADLLRVRGVEEADARLLASAGIDTVGALAAQTPDELSEILSNLNSKKRMVQHDFPATMMAEWIDHAKQFEPML